MTTAVLKLVAKLGYNSVLFCLNGDWVERTRVGAYNFKAIRSYVSSEHTWIISN